MFYEKKGICAHVNKFIAICEELSSYGEEIYEKHKSSKLISSIPPLFSALAMVISVTETTFDKIVEAVKAEFARSANLNNLQSKFAGYFASQVNSV